MVKHVSLLIQIKSQEKCKQIGSAVADLERTLNTAYNNTKFFKWKSVKPLPSIN